MTVEYKITEKLREDCIAEILRVERKKGLTPKNLVEEAKDESNPLHEFFEWEDSVAANEYRLYQARVLINEVKVIIDQKEYFAFENVAIKVSEKSEETERVYKPVAEIIQNEELRKQILKSALHSLTYWQEKFSKYEEVKPIVKSIIKVRKKLEKKWQQKKE